MSRMTLLRLIRARPLPEQPEVITVLGVDHFAFRRGHTDGRIFVDMKSTCHHCRTGLILMIYPVEPVPMARCFVAEAQTPLPRGWARKGGGLLQPRTLRS